MTKSSQDFSLKVDGVNGLCPTGETWAEKNLTEGKIPVFSCEDPCIRGEIELIAAEVLSYIRKTYGQ